MIEITFVTHLTKLYMLVREATEFNSMFEPNNIREFYMALMVSRFDAKLDVCTKCFHTSVPEL